MYSNYLCQVFNIVSYIQMDAIKMLWFNMQDEGNKRKILSQEIEQSGHKGRKNSLLGWRLVPPGKKVFLIVCVDLTRH